MLPVVGSPEYGGGLFSEHLTREVGAENSKISIYRGKENVI